MLASLASADDAIKQQLIATRGIVGALMRMLNSSDAFEQEAAAAALYALQQQVSSEG
jgi:hypothetical protein